MIDFDEGKQKGRITDLYKKEEEELVQMLADRYGIPFVDLSTTSIEMEALRMLGEKESRDAGVAAFKAIGKKLFVACISPQNNKAKMIIEDLQRKAFDISLFMASKASLERAWSFYKDMSLASETKAGVLDIASAELETIMASLKNIEDVRALIRERMNTGKGHKVTTMLEILLAGALATKASDIHIEPEEEIVKVRFRLDGVLAEIYSFDFDTNKLLTSRLKLLSKLKINTKSTSQDGRFSIVTGGREIEMRVSLIPGAYGESVVMRILNPDNINVPFESLGIEPKLFALIEQAIARPNGIILNTGPTGSGKTTTLYSILRKVHTSDIKIITIEDPVEYHVAGITQTQVEEEKGYTFLSGLRAAMRQDPDIIMVGEIRDEDTAKVAINAALTGHLVLSTLHTNSAAGSVPRLVELGVNPKILASALSLALAQRLVRKICEHCKEVYVPIEPEKKIIENTIVQMIQEGKGDTLEALSLPDYTLYRGRGCDRCHNGYKGRIGIYEAIVMDGHMDEALDEPYPSERDIKLAAVSQGIPTLKQDAIIKVLQGVTTLEEVGKVVDLYGA